MRRNTGRYRIRRFGWALALSIAGVIGLLWLGARRLPIASLRQGPIHSVVLITIDTLRADHLSSYGYPRETSPNLDAFMARGTRFAHAFSTAASTAPSHVAMMTGWYPGFTTVGVENGVYPLSPDVTTLAQLCGQAGLRTAAVVSNAVLRRQLGLDRGFESYDDDLREQESGRPMPEQTAAHAVAKALAKLAEFRGAPFFLWLHLQDPHGPYTPPGRWAEPFTGDDLDRVTSSDLPVGPDHSGYQAIPDYQALGTQRRRNEYVRRYDGEIAYLDSELEKLFETVTTSGMLANTLIVVTADHGEALGEDGFYFAHGHSLGIDQTQVPLAFLGPGIPAGVVLNRAVSNIAVFCTILNALHITDAARCEQSDSLLSSLLAGTEPAPAIGFGASVSQWAAFRDTAFVRRDAYPPDDPTFATTANPVTGERYVPLGEQVLSVNGGPVDDADLAGLRVALQGFITEAEIARRTLAEHRHPAVTLPPEQVERLRALGYLK